MPCRKASVEESIAMIKSVISLASVLWESW
jgi:hypothetical protein